MPICNSFMFFHLVHACPGEAVEPQRLSLMAANTLLPSGHAVGVRDPTSIETPGPRGIPQAASPMETSRFFFISFLGQTPIRPGIQRPQVQGKRAGVQVSEPGNPVQPQKTT